MQVPYASARRSIDDLANSSYWISEKQTEKWRKLIASLKFMGRRLDGGDYPRKLEDRCRGVITDFSKVADFLRTLGAALSDNEGDCISQVLTRLNDRSFTPDEAIDLLDLVVKHYREEDANRRGSEFFARLYYYQRIH